MNTLPLHEHHQALGATFQQDGNWEIPSHYSHPELEYEDPETGNQVFVHRERH